MSDERNTQREKSRNNARTFGGIVYVGGTVAATVLFMTFVLTAFEPDQYLTRIIMIIASLAVGSSMLAFPVAMHNWIVTKDHRFWGTILYYGEMLLIAINTVVSFIMLLGMDIPWAKSYEPFSVASIIYTVFAWGTIFLLDPQHREYADEQDNETERRRDVEGVKKQFRKTEEGKALIAQMAAAEIAAEWTVENHLAHKGIKPRSVLPDEAIPAPSVFHKNEMAVSSTPRIQKQADQSTRVSMQDDALDQAYMPPAPKPVSQSRFQDAEDGELTIKQVRESGLCNLPPAVFKPNPSEELQDMVQAKGGLPCRAGGEFVTWAGSKRTCEKCTFFKGAPKS